MKLNAKEWGKFRIGDILYVVNGKGITEEEVNELPGELYAIQGGSRNNGSLGKISKEYCESMGYRVMDKPCLTVARVGSAGCVNFQDSPCVVGDKAKALVLKGEHNNAVYLFLATILSRNTYKYSYGRGLVTETYMSEIIELPILRDHQGQPILDPKKTYSKDGYIPDFEFMENYIKSLNHKPLTTANVGGGRKDNLQLDIDKWKEYKLGYLFNVVGSKTTPIDDLEDVGMGEYPYVTTSSQNNGVAGNYNLHTESGNVLTVESACMGYSTYQLRDFTASDHVEKLTPKFKLNPSIALFIVTLINRENVKYSYGRKCNQVRINDMGIKLPTLYEPDGITPKYDPTKKYSAQGYIPDFDFMERYIKSLPYGDRV